MQVVRPQFVIQIAIVLFASVVAAQTPTSTTSTTCESRIFTDGDFLLVDVHRNKQVYRFVLDTGASHTILDSGSFKHLLAQTKDIKSVPGNGGTTGQQFKNPNDFYVGGKLPIESPHLYAMSLVQFSAGHGAKIDGVLGCDFLNNYVVRLDFDAEKVTIGKNLSKPPVAPFNFYRDDFQLPTVDVPQLDPSGSFEEPCPFMIDTGAVGIVQLTLNRDRFHTSIRNKQLTYEEVTKSVDITGPVQPGKGRLRGFGLWLNSAQELRVMETMADSTNKICLPYLLRFNLTLDLPKSQIYVQPRKAPSAEWKDRSGLTLIRYPTDLVVDDVHPQSPAAKADMRNGDVIVSIDSVPSEKFRLTPLRILLCEEGKRVRLIMRRDTKMWPVDLTLTDYRRPATKADFE